jgi:hypothetical protein
VAFAEEKAAKRRFFDKVSVLTEILHKRQGNPPELFREKEETA